MRTLPFTSLAAVPQANGIPGRTGHTLKPGQRASPVLYLVIGKFRGLWKPLLPPFTWPLTWPIVLVLLENPVLFLQIWLRERCLYHFVYMGNVWNGYSASLGFGLHLPMLRGLLLSALRNVTPGGAQGDHRVDQISPWKGKQLTWNGNYEDLEMRRDKEVPRFEYTCLFFLPFDIRKN